MLVAAQYDNVFRTLVNDCPKLLIPFINEVFKEHYSEETPIRFYPNEHFANQKDGKMKKRITDTCFEILDTVPKKYHLECQSTSDSSMLIRMFEYGAQIALDDGEVRENVLTVNFPYSAILYLRCGKNTPDKIRVVIRAPAGKLDYEIAVVKLNSYSLEEIFNKKLLFLIPFYIFTHESRFKVYDEDKEQRKMLLEEYQYIRDRLEEMALAGEIDEYIKRTLMEMSGKILEYLTRNHKKVQKGVKSVMVGKVLDYEAKRILKRGISQGLSRGINQGKIDAYRELLRDGLITPEEASKRLKISRQEAEKLMK